MTRMQEIEYLTVQGDDLSVKIARIMRKSNAASAKPRNNGQCFGRMIAHYIMTQKAPEAVTSEAQINAEHIPF